ncbi:MAG: c-type cytochrome [Pontibacterium sp.]
MDIKLIKPLTIVAVLAASGLVSAAETMEQAAGKEVFKRCQACHSGDSSKNTFGPSLTGVVGRSAASLPRYNYSSALRQSGITWTEENLRKWVTDNEKLVPGTRMRHVSITDAAEQSYLIAYLKSL